MSMTIDPFNGNATTEAVFADEVSLREPRPNGMTKQQWAKKYVEKMVRQTLRAWREDNARKQMVVDNSDIPEEN